MVLGIYRRMLTLLTSLPFIYNAADWDLEHYTHGRHKTIHFVETLLALGQNVQDPAIGEIRVLLDGHGTSEATRALRAAVATAQHRNAKYIDRPGTDLDKIHAEIFGRHATYVDLLNYSNTRLAGRVVAMLNADIVLRNAARVDLAELRRSSTVLTLSVTLPSGRYGEFCAANATQFLRNECNESNSKRGLNSWDVFVFAAPIRGGPMQFHVFDFKGPVYMNSWGGEYRALIFFRKMHYTWYNPCTTVIAEHWHCLGGKTHASGSVFWHVGPVPADLDPVWLSTIEYNSIADPRLTPGILS